MAGHASNWFKVGRGSTKGRVFISNSTLSAVGLTKERVRQLPADDLITLSQASPQPTGMARTGDDLSGMVTIQTANGPMEIVGEQRGKLQVHRDPSSEGYVVAYKGHRVGTASTLKNAREAADLLQEEDFAGAMKDESKRERIAERVADLMRFGLLETPARRREREWDERSAKIEREARARDRLRRKAERDPEVVAARRAYDDALKAQSALSRKHDRLLDTLNRPFESSEERQRMNQRDRELATELEQLVDRVIKLDVRRSNVEKYIQGLPSEVPHAQRRLDRGVYNRSFWESRLAEAQAAVRKLRGTGDRAAQKAAREELNRAKFALDTFDRMLESGEIEGRRTQDMAIISGDALRTAQENLARLNAEYETLRRARQAAEEALTSFRQRREEGRASWQRERDELERRIAEERKAMRDQVEQLRRALQRTRDDVFDRLWRQVAPTVAPETVQTPPPARGGGSKRSRRR